MAAPLQALTIRDRSACFHQHLEVEPDLQGPEIDIQHLRVAAGLTRAEAMQSLSEAAGDLHTALKNELSSHHLDTELVNHMLEEYRAYRQAAAPACSLKGRSCIL